MAKKSVSAQSKSPNLVVGIGASAGGLSALRKFLSKLQKADHVSFVLVQHLDESGANLAHDVLTHQVKMPVVEIANGTILRGGVFYHAPAHSNIALKKGVFKVEHAVKRSDQFSVIDSFLKSLAKDQAERAVGIILSGDGSDGAQGVKAISDAGGMNLAQIPESADFPSMPQNAIATGAVDHTVLPEDMPAQLISYSAFIAKLFKENKTAAMFKQINSALIEICDILHKVTNHDFKHYKTSTLIRRIQRRMQVLQLSNVDQYVDKLRLDPKESDSLFKELLINVTSFFRDPEAFETLKEDVLESALKNRKADQKYRVWVAGCSTGEEVYTLAILLRETISKMAKPPELQIIATDIDESALNQARKGSYPLTISENVSPARLRKYFDKKNGRYVVSKDLREIVLFSSHNLINDPPFSQLDLISCRNLLIYLGPHLQKKLIPVFHYALRSGGSLFLGSSETLTGHKELFRTTSAKHRIGQRKATSIRPPGFSASIAQSFASHPVEPTKSHETDIHLVSQRIVLDEFAPKYAVVNDDCQIVSISGGLEQYLGPSEGVFQNSLLKLVKTSLRLGLRSAFNEAKKQKRKVTHQNSTLKLDTELARIGITVQPMPQLGDESGLFMVVFHYFGAIRSKEDVKNTLDGSHVDMLVVEELERELVVLREDLDRSVQDLEASNEELKSSNEELLSMNEELQSANEELEASKEEVQHANEALQRGNSDLENLLASTEIATLFLDDHLNIQNFTPQLDSIYNVTRVDLLRPITHLTNLASEMPEFPNLEDVVTKGIVEDDVRMKDGRSILRRVSPYRTTEGLISGLVATFIDVSSLRAAESKRRESEERFQVMADSAPVLIWIAGPDQQRTWFNKGWLQWTGRTMKQEHGMGWTAGVHPDDFARCLATYAESFEQKKDFYIEYRLLHHSGEYRWVNGRAVPRFTKNGTFEGFVGGCMDIHIQKMAQVKINENQDRLNQMISTSPSFMCMLTGPEYTFEQANDRYLQLVGHRDIVGKTIRQALPEIAEQGFIGLLDSVRNSGKPYIGTEVMAMLQRKPGDPLERRYLDFVYQPDETIDGKVQRIFVHGVDVTEKVMVRQSIENERSNFRNLFKQTPEMVCILSGPEHRFEFVNEAHIKALGFDATGKTVFEAQPESVEVHGLLDGVYRTGITAELTEIPVTLGDRIRYFNLTYAARFDLNGQVNGVMILGTEISHEVLYRIELQAAKDDAEKARRAAESANESKTRFLANMSHEIRTPLAAVLGFSELLKGRTKPEDADAEIQLDRISRNATQLGRLIDELLDLSKIEAERLEIERTNFNVQTALQDALASVSLMAEQKGLAFKQIFKTEIPKIITTDATRFKQILTNVIGNAVKFTEKGRVEVHVEKFDSHGKHYLRIHVKDTGIGLTAEQKNKLFEAFMQADPSVTRKYGGTGLGLVLSRQLARLLGGDLTLEQSELGAGSTFLINIEIGIQEANGKDLQESREQNLAANDKNILAGHEILVVDDSVDNQTIISLFLTNVGAKIEIANNGLEAVEKMAAKKYDAVLMDIQMPVMDGYQSLQTVRAQGYDHPIIALTAHAMKDEKERCLASGFTDYMSKPINRALLVQRLSDIIKSKMQ